MRATNLLVVLLIACGRSPNTAIDADIDPPLDTPTCASELAHLEQQLADALDAATTDTSLTTDPNVTLLLERDDGRRFTHSHGASTPMSSYESASTSKLVSAVVILDLVNQGKLSLDDTAHDLINPDGTGYWVETAITLRHLLSFRSGLDDEPLCINNPNANFATCVKAIYDANISAGIAPGAHFYYSSTHLQIAGLMAMNATGKTWSQIYSEWQTKTGIMTHSTFDLPSIANPRLAGGMHWVGEDYLGLLRALAHGTILSTTRRQELFANQRGGATVAASPIVAALNEDWAYGLGNWLECPTAIGPNTFDCGDGHRNSSPGAYGAYPFIDFDHHYVGILARQGPLGTFREGVAVFRSVQDLATPWADVRCGS